MMYILSNPLSLILILTGLTLLITGLVFLYYPPKKINGIYGYRTNNSRQSEKHWHFAQNYSAKLMVWISFIMIGLGFSALLINLDVIVAAILGTAIILVLLGLMIYKTEKALKDNF